MSETKQITCPLCGDTVNKLLYRFHVENEKVVLEKIKEHNPAWTEHDGICGRCVDYYQTELVMQQRILPEIGPYFSIKSPDDFIILPTMLRLNADPRFTGKGITICFIDSGFYLHDDIIATSNRVRKVVDITNPKQNTTYFMQPHKESWHGTMTTVVCAGDGYKSKGLYKGVAPDAELVLLKVMNEEGHITTENIAKALEWVLKNHRQYDIKIVNMSLGDDEAISCKNSVIDELAEKLIDEGITIVAAVGNDDTAEIKPPANSPNVIAIGGVDDANQLENELMSYHSSFGVTTDGLHKPELVANAIWIAAPILPGTAEKEEAEILHELVEMSNEDLQTGNLDLLKKTGISHDFYKTNDVTFLRSQIITRIQTTKFFSAAYMHVDGTSFAAPIVSGVIAQLLQAQPSLTPQQIRRALFSSAKRLSGIPVERQGYGYIQPKKALLKILKKEVIMKPHDSPHIDDKRKTIEFFIQNDCAHQISLAGTFNHWAQDVLLMEPGEDGMWKIEIPLLPEGTYKYKFFIDDKMWVEDFDNPVREPDGFNGWNSILMIQ
ncbi:MAG: S8 family serine peptidase [Sphingobacteriales bacterium]|nr:S8 family serine peptidase [Sphingobacteriales bacterium]MBI3718102.1 S8 family serine peptidase [Sphingobacteriales bacterium]